MYYVYLLKSELNNEFYVGSTSDLRRRFEEHNSGREISTKRYAPWALLYYEAYAEEKLARMREKKLKYHGNAMRELKKRMGILGQINQKSGGLPSTTFSSQKSGAGFTMVEMVIYIGALALLVGTVTALLVWLVRASSEVHVRNELATGVEHAFALMVNEIKEAKSVYTPTTTSSQLSLATSNNVPDKETSTYIDFFLCGTRLCMKREFQTPQALTSEKIIIQNLEFIPVQTGSAASAHIIIEASYLDASQTLQTTASLRSYE